MSTWTTPATFVAAAVTVASMNTEIRDHALFLKGALDVLTGSTTADTGATMLLDINRAAASDTFRSRVTADATARLALTSSGLLSFGSGAAAADVHIYRSAANRISIDRDGAGAGGFLFDTSATAFTNFFYIPPSAYIYWNEGTAPTAGAVNEARMFCRDNGAGKTQLAVQFNTGAVQVMATEP